MKFFKKKQKNYTYQEWLELDEEFISEELRRWTLYGRKIGKKTQSELVKGFNTEYSKIKAEVLTTGFDFIGWGSLIPCIYIVVSNSKIRLPNYFASLPLNKGIIQEKLEDDKYVIKWRHGGSKNLVQIKNGKLKHLGLYKWRERKK